MASDTFSINVEEPFDTLKSAPIVEAIIDWRVTLAVQLDPKQFEVRLRESLPSYDEIKPRWLVGLRVELDAKTRVAETDQWEGWDGFELRRSDELPFVIRVGNKGVSVSRLTPYTSWSDFQTEAMAVWRAFVGIAFPAEIQRLSLRYVNRISAPTIDELCALLRVPVTPPGDLKLPTRQFLHQTQFDVPGEAFRINLVRTVPETGPQAVSGLDLLVDIDIFSTQNAFSPDDKAVIDHLRKMRWLKNKMFFEIFADDAIEQFKR